MDGEELRVSMEKILYELSTRFLDESRRPIEEEEAVNSDDIDGEYLKIKSRHDKEQERFLEIIKLIDGLGGCLDSKHAAMLFLMLEAAAERKILNRQRLYYEYERVGEDAYFEHRDTPQSVIKEISEEVARVKYQSIKADKSKAAKKSVGNRLDRKAQGELKKKIIDEWIENKARYSGKEGFVSANFKAWESDTDYPENQDFIKKSTALRWLRGK